MADGSVLIDTKLDSSGLQKGLDSLGGIASRGLSVVTKAIAGVSTAIAAVGTYAVKMGSDFESAMSEVAAISGATAEDIDRLTEKAKQMGATTKFSASQSAEAFKYMAMAGWKTEDMLNGIEGIMNLAAASGEDLGVSSDIVTDALTAMGYAAGDAGRLADVMAAASSNANTNVALMGETFKYAAPLMGAMNYTMEDTALAIGLMANAGIKGSQAGTDRRSRKYDGGVRHFPDRLYRRDETVPRGHVRSAQRNPWLRSRSSGVCGKHAGRTGSYVGIPGNRQCF